MRWMISKVLAAAGRQYKVDPGIPSATLISVILARTRDAVRGVLRMRTVCFVGSSVTIRQKSNLFAGHLSAIGKNSTIDCSGTAGVRLGVGAKLGSCTVVTSTSQLSKRGVGLVLGDQSGIGDFAHIGCSGGVTIGRDVIMGPFATFHSQEHLTEDTKRPIRVQGTKEAPVVIHDGVWAGARCTFLAGSIVGHDSIVAAGSVVRGEFPPNSVIGGIPARLIKSRIGTPNIEKESGVDGVGNG